MTFLPHETRDVRGLAGPQFPRYKVGPVCSVPGCSRYVDHSHHLWRRSFIGGDFSWVELWDHTIVGNLCGLCYKHHQLITENQMRIAWQHDNRMFVWANDQGSYIAPLYPQPPIHGVPVGRTKPTAPEEPGHDGPASTDICPGCKRPIPKPRLEGETREARRRKTWTVAVPDDGEDGALVLDTLLEECRDLFKHSDDKNVRYHTLIQALALVVQHGHRLLGDE